MSETTMVERVARKLCEQEGADPYAIRIGEGRAAGRTWLGWEAHVSHARELLTVMREPTDDMCDAGELTATDPCDRMFAGEVYRAMIDEALAQKEKTVACRSR